MQGEWCAAELDALAKFKVTETFRLSCSSLWTLSVAISDSWVVFFCSDSGR